MSAKYYRCPICKGERYNVASRRCVRCNWPVNPVIRPRWKQDVVEKTGEVVKSEFAPYIVAGKVAIDG